MSLSCYPQITEELLSAYLDDLVSTEEQQMIEQAVANDPQIAWQLDSLRQTVHLLQSLPALALPRAFTLDAATIAVLVAREPQGVFAPEATSTTRESWWQRLITTLQGNNPVLRTVSAAAAALLLVILVASSWLLSPTPDAPQMAQSSAPAEMAVASAGNGTTDNEVARSETATVLVATLPVANRTEGLPSPAAIMDASEQAIAQATGTSANEAQVNSDPQGESAPLASAAASNGVATQSAQPTPAAEVSALAQNHSAPETSALAQAPAEPAVELSTATQPVATQFAPGDDTQPLEGSVASQNETATAFNVAIPDNTMANGVATDDDQATVAAAKTAGAAQEAGSATEVAVTVDAVAQETERQATVPQEDQSATEVVVLPEASTEKEPLLRAAKVTTQSVIALVPLTATAELTASAGVSDEVTLDDLITATLTTTIPVTSSMSITDISPDSVASDLLVTAVVTTVVAATETTAVDAPDPSPVLTETMPATATIAAVTDIITATVALLPQQTATKPTTRRTTVATATTMPLRTPTALPQVMLNDTLPATLTAQVPLTATNTPTVTTTPSVTATITTTATVTGTLTPVGTPLGQQPTIILMSANIDVKQSLQGIVLLAVQALVSLLVTVLGVLWWRSYTAVGHR